MPPELRAEFESTLAAQLTARNGPAVAELLSRDPLNRYALGFNRHMAAVDAGSIGVAYRLPLTVLAGKVTAGKIANVETLFKMLAGIQKRTALKLGPRPDRPRARGRRGRPPGAWRENPPSFARGGGTPDDAPGHEPDPSCVAERRELFPVLLAGVRRMGRLPFRVFREVRAFGARQGTQFGAFPAVARLAVLGVDGRVVAIRPYDPNRPAGGTPPSGVVRQIRASYHQAVAELRSRALWKGGDDL